MIQVQMSLRIICFVSCQQIFPDAKGKPHSYRVGNATRIKRSVLNDVHFYWVYFSRGILCSTTMRKTYIYMFAYAKHADDDMHETYGAFRVKYTISIIIFFLNK